MKKYDDLLIGDFKPCVIENREVGLTTYIHEDVVYYAKPMSGTHWVDALLAEDDGRLIGVNFWFVTPAPRANEAATSIPATEKDMVTKYEIIARIVGAMGEEVEKINVPCSACISSRLVRITLELMRNPTQDMFRAYSHALKNYIESVPVAERAGRWGINTRNGYLISDHEKAKVRWQAMIDVLIAGCSGGLSSPEEHESATSIPTTEKDTMTKCLDR